MLEAGGHVIQRPMSSRCAENAPGFTAKGAGRKARQRMKTRAERSQAFVPCFEANVGDAVIPGQEQLLGMLDSQPRHELVGSFMEGVREETMEIERRQARVGSGFSERCPLIEMGRQVVAGAAQAGIVRHVLRNRPLALDGQAKPLEHGFDVFFAETRGVVFDQ